MVLKWEGVTLQRGDPRFVKVGRGSMEIDLDERIVGSQKSRAGSQNANRGRRWLSDDSGGPKFCYLEVELKGVR